MFDPDRIAYAAAALDAFGAVREETPFGLFLHNPDYPDPAAAAKLVMTRCQPDEVEALLEDVEGRCAALHLPEWSIGGYDEDTFATLNDVLPARGYRLQRFLTHRKVAPPQHDPNTDIKLAEVMPGFDDRALIVYQRAGLPREAMAYRRDRLRRIGGMEVLAFLDRRTVGVGGWYTVEGVTTLMPAAVVPTAQGQGVASTLINHITHHPDLEVSEALVLVTTDQVPSTLFERMGFAVNNAMWEFVREA